MDWTNISSAFAAKAQLNFLTASFVCLYLYFRKKLKLFMWLSIAFFADFIIIKLSFAYYLKFVIFILSICLPIVVNYKEINTLDKTGESASKAFKIDNKDKVVFGFVVLIYFFLRICYVDNIK